MSLWHSPQRAESMKKFDGMMPPTFVFAEDGKNGDFGPPPSPSIVTGAVSGLTIRSAGDRCVFAYPIAATGRTSAKTAAAGNPIPKARGAVDERSVRTAKGISAATPRAAAT